MNAEQLKDVIKRAKAQFCSDGSDGEIAAKMFEILCEFNDDFISTKANQGNQ